MKMSVFASIALTITLVLTSAAQILAQPLLNVSPADFNHNQKVFVENKGQIYDGKGNFRSDVDFVASFGGMNMYFTDHGVVYHFFKVEPSKYDLIRSGKIENPYTPEEWERINKDISAGKMDLDLVETKGFQYRIDIEFPGADLSRPTGVAAQKETRNFFNPHYPDGIYGVASFSQIRYTDAYPGIDLVFYFEKGNMKYDFEVDPGADPSQIKVLYKGQQRISIDEGGNAVISILPGQIVEQRPVAYQNDTSIPASFALVNDTLSFNVGQYSSDKKLIIDPALTWSTFFYDNVTNSGAFTYSRPQWDSDGNMFILLDTYATTFPTVNPGGTSFYLFTPGDNGLQMVIMKFDPYRNLVWATYYTSSQSASTNFNNQGLVIDQNDDIYCVGHMFFVYATPTPAFPTQFPAGAYSETTPNNNRNFILKFANDGTRLWSTVFCTLGSFSSGLDISALAIDGSNRLVMAGDTYTPDGSWTSIPTANPGGSYYYNTTPAEEATPTLFRFTTGLALEYGTYVSRGVASQYFNYGTTLALDASNNIFMSNAGTGNITTANPGGAYIDATGGTGRKLILYKFLSTGALSWCTLYGGLTSANSIVWQDTRDAKVASNGDVVFVGRVNTTDFPTYNPGGGAFYKSTLSAGGTSVCDGIILKFSNTGARLWATYIGGDGTSDGTDLMGLGIDSDNNIYTSGICRSTSFPTQTLAGSYNQSSMTGSYAIILNMFNASNVRLWGTYFGTGTWMSSGGFGVDDWVCDGVKIMQMGTTPSATPITTVDPGGGAYYNATAEGTTCDFFAEFFYGTMTGSDATITPAGPFCLTDAATTLSAVDAGGTWSGTGITNASAGTFDPATAGAGSHEITYTISGVCGDVDTVIIVVSTELDAAINSAGPFCVNDGPATLTAVNAGGTWAGTGITNASAGTFDPGTAGVGTHQITYTTAGSCSDTDTISLVVSAVLDATIDPAGPFCISGGIVTLNAATPGGSWTGDGITNLLTGTFNPAMAGIGSHEITYSTTGSCADSDTIYIVIVDQLDATIDPITDMCVTDSTLLLTAANPGGVWSGTGISNPATGAFSPALAGTGTFTITYTISGDCGDSDTETVTVRDCDDLDYHAIVPNAFSPNNDGENDMLYVRGYGVSVLSFTVYDRLGEKVFETNNLNTGWDGVYRGKELDPAVFTYVLEVTFIDNTTKFEKGNVTLIK